MTDLQQNSDVERACEKLVALCRALGDPAHDWAILGEGNASCRIDGESFLVKASGSQMSTLTGSSIVQLSSFPLLAQLDHGSELTDTETAELLKSAVLGRTGLMPSVESLIHAYLLTLEGISAVGHTHVLTINSLLCSERGWESICSGGRLFPDEIVVCGAVPCCVPYTDPGLPLARAVREAVVRYQEAQGAPPKTIYLQNHGFIALGRTCAEVVAITAMAEKAAKILLGTFACGGPKFLTPESAARIATRPDEKYRQKALGLTED